MAVGVLRLSRSRNGSGEVVVRLGARLLDEYLEFLAGRCRPNTVLAVAYDLKVFFTVDTPAFGPISAMKSRVVRHNAGESFDGSQVHNKGGPVMYVRGEKTRRAVSILAAVAVAGGLATTVTRASAATSRTAATTTAITLQGSIAGEAAQ